jgi:hypothetical protein
MEEEEEARRDELETDHDTMSGHEGERNWTLVGSSRDGGANEDGPARPSPYYTGFFQTGLQPWKCHRLTTPFKKMKMLLLPPIENKCRYFSTNFL